MRNGSLTKRGRALWGVVVLAWGGVAAIADSSTASARHNGRKTRRACAEAANNSAMSGVFSTDCNCDPAHAA